MWWCSPYHALEYVNVHPLQTGTWTHGSRFCLVTPLDVVKTRLQTQEISGVRHLEGTLVCTWIVALYGGGGSSGRETYLIYC